MQIRYVAVAALVAVPFLSLADDGWVGFGGNPRLMTKENPQIRMASETVDLRVVNGEVHANCIFHFKNDGPACVVQMGFPDYGEHDTGQTKSAFRYFRSWVNGKRVRMSFKVDATAKKEEDHCWQVKSVSFPAHAMVTVRDSYAISCEIEPVDGIHRVRGVPYILHTGASWKGTIGVCDVTIHLPIKGVPDVQEGGFPDKTTLGWWRTNRVLWVTGEKPSVSRGTLRLHLKNLEPGEADDIRMYFGVFKV